MFPLFTDPNDPAYALHRAHHKKSKKKKKKKDKSKDRERRHKHHHKDKKRKRDEIEDGENIEGLYKSCVALSFVCTICL